MPPKTQWTMRQSNRRRWTGKNVHSVHMTCPKPNSLATSTCAPTTSTGRCKVGGWKGRGAAPPIRISSTADAATNTLPPELVSYFYVFNNYYSNFSLQKRKRNAYLVSGMSPPQTRQSTKRRSAAEKASPPQPSKQSAPWPPAHKDKETAAASGAAVAAELKNGTENGTTITTVYPSFPAIPNLPSGLIIERVSPGSPSPDSKTCIKCKQPGKVFDLRCGGLC